MLTGLVAISLKNMVHLIQGLLTHGFAIEYHVNQVIGISQ